MAPEGTVGAASGSAHRFHRHAEAFDDIQAIALAVRHAFDDGADQVGALCLSVRPIQPPRAVASRWGVRSPIK